MIQNPSLQEVLGYPRRGSRCVNILRPGRHAGNLWRGVKIGEKRQNYPILGYNAVANNRRDPKQDRVALNGHP